MDIKKIGTGLLRQLLAVEKDPVRAEEMRKELERRTATREELERRGAVMLDAVTTSVSSAIDIAAKMAELESNLERKKAAAANPGKKHAVTPAHKLGKKIHGENKKRLSVHKNEVLKAGLEEVATINRARQLMGVPTLGLNIHTGRSSLKAIQDMTEEEKQEMAKRVEIKARQRVRFNTSNFPLFGEEVSFIPWGGKERLNGKVVGRVYDPRVPCIFLKISAKGRGNSPGLEKMGRRNTTFQKKVSDRDMLFKNPEALKWLVDLRDTESSYRGQSYKQELQDRINEAEIEISILDTLYHEKLRNHVPNRVTDKPGADLMGFEE